MTIRIHYFAMESHLLIMFIQSFRNFFTKVEFVTELTLSRAISETYKKMSYTHVK